MFLKFSLTFVDAKRLILKYWYFSISLWYLYKFINIWVFSWSVWPKQISTTSRLSFITVSPFGVYFYSCLSFKSTDMPFYSKDCFSSDYYKPLKCCQSLAFSKISTFVLSFLWSFYSRGKTLYSIFKIFLSLGKL